MNPTHRSRLVQALQQQQTLARQVLDLVETESTALNRGETGLPPETARRKRELLPQLHASMSNLRTLRQGLQQLPPQDRDMDPPLRAFVRSTQDLLLKVIVLDRENEQLLLRKGQVPSEHLKQVQTTRPHFAASVYQRNAASR